VPISKPTTEEGWNAIPRTARALPLIDTGRHTRLPQCVSTLSKIYRQVTSFTLAKGSHLRRTRLELHQPAQHLYPIAFPRLIKKDQLRYLEVRPEIQSLLRPNKTPSPLQVQLAQRLSAAPTARSLEHRAIKQSKLRSIPNPARFHSAPQQNPLTKIISASGQEHLHSHRSFSSSNGTGIPSALVR